jgi:amidase
MNDIVFSTAITLAAAIRCKEVSALEVLEAHLAQIARRNPRLNAIVTLDIAGARQRAQAADQALARGELWGPLHGVPLTLKDSHSVAGMRTTSGYEPLAHYVPAEDGAVAARLKSAGAIILGKTNVPVLLADFQTENPIFGRANNPWDLDRTPGGSSGGAAAALAAGMAPLEVGSDFGGSIRVPAHCCGVYGLKTTEHRVSRIGHIPNLPGLPRATRIIGVMGPLARCIDDLELAFGILAGADGRDTDVPPLPLRPEGAPPLRALRIAWAPAFPGSPVASEIRQAIERLATELDRLGGRVEQRLPDVDFAQQLALYSELSNDIISVFKPVPEGAQPISLASYLTALDRRDAFILAWEQFFDAWDVLLCPAAMTAAPAHCPIGTPFVVDGQEAPYARMTDCATPFNLTGHPAVVLPLAQDRCGLPIGVQVVGRRWGEERLLAIARTLSQLTPGYQRPPGY